MKFEKLNKNYTKNIIIGLIVIIIIGSVLVLNITKAKYRTTTSINIVNGTVKYSGGNADLNVIAVYQQKDGQTCTEVGCYDTKDDIPLKDYKLNKDNSYCTIPGNDNKIKNMLDFKSNKLIVDITKKGTKCYLYFDKMNSLREEIISKATENELEKCPSIFNKMETSQSLICKAPDEFGESYYFRGVVDDNWVQYGHTAKDDTDETKIWWRIIRINGDGSIRLIYAGIGASAPEVGGKASLINSYNYYNYNSNLNNDIYSKYSGSNAEKEVNNWFDSNLNDEWNDGNGQIETNGKFCNDMSGSSSEHGAVTRLRENSSPSFICPSDGGIAIIAKVALITADEMTFAGALNGSYNKNFYLNSGTDGNYWTMSPFQFYSGSARVFVLNHDGNLSWGNVNGGNGLRPVINLKSDTKFTYEYIERIGTTSNPYIVS